MHLAAVKLSTSSISTNTSASGSSTTSCSTAQRGASQHAHGAATFQGAAASLASWGGAPSAAARMHAATNQSTKTDGLWLETGWHGPAAHLDLGKQAGHQLAALAEPLAEQAVGVDLNEHAVGVPAQRTAQLRYICCTCAALRT